MRYRFGKKSQERLDTCHIILQHIANKVMNYQVMDFAVLEGHRIVERQQQLFQEGRSKIDGIGKKGKHNFDPSEGIDLLPCPTELNGINVWNDKHRFTVLAGMMFAAAADFPEVRLRWGGDWDGDGNGADQSFNDLPHYEIIFVK